MPAYLSDSGPISGNRTGSTVPRPLAVADPGQLSPQQVAQFQQYLTTMGFNTGSADGQWGHNTQAAYDAMVNAFQTGQGPWDPSAPPAQVQAATAWMNNANAQYAKDTGALPGQPLGREPAAPAPAPQQGVDFGGLGGGGSAGGGGGGFSMPDFSGVASGLAANQHSQEDAFQRALDAQNADAAAQLQQQRAQQQAQYQAEIGQIQSNEAAQLGQLQPKIGELQAQHDLQKAQAAQQGVLNDARMTDGIYSHGLGLSGIRLGDESRFQTGLATAQSARDIASQQSQDAITRAIEALRAKDATDIGQINTKLGALGNAPAAGVAPSADPLARAASPYGTGPGGQAGTPIMMQGTQIGVSFAPQSAQATAFSSLHPYEALLQKPTPAAAGMPAGAATTSY